MFQNEEDSQLRFSVQRFWKKTKEKTTKHKKRENKFFARIYAFINVLSENVAFFCSQRNVIDLYSTPFLCKMFAFEIVL